MDDYQYFPKNNMFSFENLEIYYLLDYHTSRQAALDFRAYTEHSKRIPAASKKGESPSGYDLLVGFAVFKQQLLKACVIEIASIFTGCGDTADASVSLVKDKGYVFTEAETGFIAPCVSERPSLDSRESMRKGR